MSENDLIRRLREEEFSRGMEGAWKATSWDAETSDLVAAAADTIERLQKVDEYHIVYWPAADWAAAFRGNVLIDQGHITDVDDAMLRRLGVDQQIALAYPYQARRLPSSTTWEDINRDNVL